MIRRAPRDSAKCEAWLLQQGNFRSRDGPDDRLGSLVHNLTLVTHNTADFQNIPGLRLDDWLTP